MPIDAEADLTAEALSRKAFGERLRGSMPAGMKLADFAAEVGISLSGLKSWLSGGSDPGRYGLVAAAKACGVDLNWLATGDGEKNGGAASPFSALPAFGGPVDRSVPVLGLAECGIAGWYRDGAMAVRATRPGDLRDPNAFAVIAVGDSMIPAGISPGYLCFCSPDDSADIGDAVYVERADRHATIKLFGGVKDGWIRLQGWLPRQDGDLHQESYVDKIRIDSVVKLATVIYVKRKL